MKPSKPDSLNRPFEALKVLLGRQRACRVPPSPRPRPKPLSPPAPPLDEEALFFEAMTGVRRMQPEALEDEPQRAAGTHGFPVPPENGLERLQRLVDCGQGFVVADTPEYMEGQGCLAPPEITRRLHRGDFAVQAHLDLHGYSLAAAREAFDAFMRDALTTGKRALLIIHGRGLSSPAEPVLKTRVAEWLSTGYWRKHVVAFASARLCDGGSGASYVLLRRRPVPKRLRRRHQRRPAARSKKII
jgi:DNA-nicking Smr family endonuclease